LSENNKGTNIKNAFFTVPNILVYIRILLVPVFVYIYINAKSDKDYYAALCVMIVAFLTDFFDGKIARRFNLVTDLGKILDPIADKLYQFAVAICLVAKYRLMIIIVIIIFIKELIMGLMGLVLLDKGGKVFGARWYGKICTGLVDCSMAFLFLSPLVYTEKAPSTLCTVLICICAVVLVITGDLYTRLFWAKIKEADAQNKKD